MNYPDFHASCEALKAFFNEQLKLNAVIRVISPTSTGVCEFGSNFIDQYVRVVEIALNDQFGWFSWFVFENDFGKKRLPVVVQGVSFTISNEADFFKICIDMHNNVACSVSNIKSLN